MKAMPGVVETVESAKPISGETGVEMTAFVNLGNEEEQVMVVSKDMVGAMGVEDGDTSEKLMKKEKKGSKKEKLVAMAMARLREMEQGMEKKGGMMAEMRLIALEPQIIGPVVEVGYAS